MKKLTRKEIKELRKEYPNYKLVQDKDIEKLEVVRRILRRSKNGD